MLACINGRADAHEFREQAVCQPGRTGLPKAVSCHRLLVVTRAELTLLRRPAIVLAYPEPHKRGKYLALWLFFKNSGQIVSGAINLATNAHNSKGGKGEHPTSQKTIRAVANSSSRSQLQDAHLVHRPSSRCHPARLPDLEPGKGPAPGS